MPKPKGKASSLPSIGDAFKSLGNAIVASSNKTNNEIKQTFTSDKAMAGYKTATNIAIGVASLTPVGKAMAMGAIAISDKVTGGKATAYLGAQNSTLDMLPGGYLAQAVVGAADPSAAAKMNSIVPDPKKMLITDATTIGKAAVTHPSSVGSVAKSVGSSNVSSLHNNTLAAASLMPSTSSSINKSSAKPSIGQSFQTQPPSTLHAVTAMPTQPKKPMFGAPSIPSQFTTRSTLPSAASIPNVPAPTPDTSTLTPKDSIPVASVLPVEIEKPSIMSAIATPSPSPPPPPRSPTLSAPSTITSVSPMIIAPTTANSSMSMMLPVVGGAVVLLFLLMKH